MAELLNGILARQITPERLAEIKQLCEENKETFLWTSNIQFYEIYQVFEQVRKAGIKEGMERAVVIVENTRSATGHNRNLTQVELCAEAIRKEIEQ